MSTTTNTNETVTCGTRFDAQGACACPTCKAVAAENRAMFARWAEQDRARRAKSEKAEHRRATPSQRAAGNIVRALERVGHRTKFDTTEFGSCYVHVEDLVIRVSDHASSVDSRHGTPDFYVSVSESYPAMTWREAVRAARAKIETESC